MIWHLADRYGRVTQVLDQLFIRGHLPVRIGGVTILEVGAGPAPALYAVRDYYDDVREWVAATKQNIHVARATTLNSIDRGPAWSGLLHILSETLLSLTHWQEQAPIPFRIQYNDLSDFSIYGEHARILDLQARTIQDEFDRACEYVSLHTARQFALDDGVYPPSAYDLVVMCNFLTNEEITDRFQAEIRAITRSLTPGGLFVVLGSAGSQYAPVYEKLQRIVATSRLRRLRKFDQPLRAHVDEWNRRLIGSQIRGDVAFSSSMAPLAFSEIMGKLPKDVVDLAREIDFPQFRVHAWKNEWFRRRGNGATRIERT